ncbi:MAG: hypothetical protein AB2556_12825 [Candidatus Thiodiazotropha sp.]
MTGLDRVFYQNATVAYVLYPTIPVKLVPLRDGDLNCVALGVVEFFEGAFRGHGHPHGDVRSRSGRRVHEGGATVDDVAELETILKRAIILRDIAGGHLRQWQIW